MARLGWLFDSVVSDAGDEMGVTFGVEMGAVIMPRFLEGGGGEGRDELEMWLIRGEVGHGEIWDEVGEGKY